jgi:hypothetical protein
MPSSAVVDVHLQSRTMSYRRFTIALVTPSMDGTTPVCCSTSPVRRWRPIPVGLSTWSTMWRCRMPSLSYNELASAAIDQERMMKAAAEANDKKRKRMMSESTGSGSSSGAPLKYYMVYTPLGVSYVDHNSSRIGPLAHNSNHGNSSSSSSSSIVPLLHHRSRLHSGHHSSFLLATFHASTVGRQVTLLENDASPSKATHREPWHLWSINRGAIRGVLHHGWAAPTTPPQRRFPWEKKC